MDTQATFAGLQRALDEGRLALRAEEAPRSRRYIPDFSLRSAIGREGRIRFGSASHVAEVRRQAHRK
jgi:IS5 family transposase